MAQKVNYSALRAEKLQETKDHVRDLLEKTGVFAESGSFSSYVLSAIADESYQTAIDLLIEYMNAKPELPAFKFRVSVHINHCVDLIHAIRSKREFPGTNKTSASKQQDLYEKVLEHFRELEHYLKQIEEIEKDIKINDVRSTVIVVKAAMNGIFFILGFVLIREVLMGGLGNSFMIVFDAMVSDFTRWVTNIFPIG